MHAKIAKLKQNFVAFKNLGEKMAAVMFMLIMAVRITLLKLGCSVTPK